MSIRAVRNNNPGNINAGQPWQGLMPRSQMNAEQAAEPRFAVFETPAWGFRAMALILLSYSKVFAQTGKVFCVTSIIERWAPPTENFTNAYITHVCALTGYTPNEALPVNRETMAKIIKAISTHEVGAWAFDEASIDKGCTLANLAV